MKKLMVKDVIQMLMEGEITKEQIFFFEDEVGYLIANEIYIINDGIIVKNCNVNYEDEYCFTDKIFIEKF